ncbi:MAG: large conductance mechanosensitive channel protein MscL [Myxococcales bacterium]|nr:large conductance mechanosensitive channel protein MscL [Myxococcales bacterium]
MLEEFKKFAMRGNVLDMAVGIIIGAAFKDVVNAFTQGMMMPPIGELVGGVDFSSLFVALDGQAYESLEAAEEAGVALIKYGVFINTLIDFVIVAFAVFLLVKGVNSMQKKEEEAPKSPPKEEVLLTEIRDLLQARS